MLASGALAVGERLPPERELAAAFGVARMTLRSALAVLERDGLVTRRVGRGGGTFVAEAHLALRGFTQLSKELRGLGLRSGTRVLDAGERPAGPGEVAVLGDQAVFSLRRLRYVNGRVVALEHVVLLAEAFPGLLARPLAGDVARLLQVEYPDAPLRFVEALEPTIVREDEADELEVAVGAPAFLVRRTGYGPSGRVLELSRDLFRGDRLRVRWESEIAVERNR